MGLELALKVSSAIPYSMLLPKSEAKFTHIKCFHDLKSVKMALYVIIQVSVVVKYFQAILFVFNMKQSEI